MASAGEDTDDGLSKSIEENEESCIIEASVVTGFEECARGEAREKFGTEVKTSRGKIIWKIPLNRLPEVLKMSSIDNCKVVMHTVPHFKFTEQNDSLARIQKMILDVDWETGLKAWRQLFDFPHPVASCPDVIPSPEDLVDVVVMTRLPQPKDKSEKKKKNQGKGKGKKKDKNQKQCDSKENDSGPKVSEQNDVLDAKNPGVVSGTQDQQSLEEKTAADIAETTEKLAKFDTNSGEKDDVDLNVVKSGRENFEIQDEDTGLKLEKEDSKGGSGDSLKNECDGASSKKESDDCKNINKSPVKLDAVTEGTLNMEEAVLKNSDSVDLKIAELDKDGRGSNSASNELTEVNSADGEHNRIKHDSEKGEKMRPHNLAPPKTVIIKKITSAEMLPKIDIKVLDPVATENVFPTALESEELRHLEPMEVDSPNASFNLKSNSVSSEKGEEGKENIKDNAIALNSESDKLAGNVGNSVLDLNPINAAAAFATSVINRLSSPPTSPTKENQASATCTTPPPTPIASMENPFLAVNSSPREPSTDNLTPISVKLTQAISDCGSSVDPLSYIKDTPLTDPAMNHPVLSESTISKSNVAESSASEVAKEHCKEVKSQSNPDEEKESLKKTPKAEPDPTKPKFRVTCNRVGQHPFDSSSAAASFGSAVITYFKWPVDLKNFDIEVLLNIDNEEVTVSIGLTKTSLHNRNMVAFGPTTLRPTICYNMLRLCRIKNGDFICDPMCGTSAIPIESALHWTNCFTFGGDFHEKAIERTAANIIAVQNKQMENKKSDLKLDAVQWNIHNFPLRDSCVDVFISDLPFGHRLGSRTVNRTLYPCLLSEMARTARPGARACLLTEDRTSLIKAIQTYGKLWQRRLVLSVNIGGLSGFVFVLIRTTTATQKASALDPSPAKPSVNTSPQSSAEPSSEPAAEVNSSVEETK